MILYIYIYRCRLFSVWLKILSTVKINVNSVLQFHLKSTDGNKISVCIQCVIF